MPIGAQSKRPRQTHIYPAFQMNKKIQILRAIAIIGVVMIHTCPAGLQEWWRGRNCAAI